MEVVVAVQGSGARACYQWPEEGSWAGRGLQAEAGGVDVGVEAAEEAELELW